MRNQVFGPQQFNHSLGHLDNVSFNNILKHKVAFRNAKPTDFEFGTREIPLRILGKKQKSSIPEFAVVGNQVKVVEYGFGRVGEGT